MAFHLHIFQVTELTLSRTTEMRWSDKYNLAQKICPHNVHTEAYKYIINLLVSSCKFVKEITGIRIHLQQHYWFDQATENGLILLHPSKNIEC